jgi:hypothetical protein
LHADARGQWPASAASERDGLAWGGLAWSADSTNVEEVEGEEVEGHDEVEVGILRLRPRCKFQLGFINKTSKEFPEGYDLMKTHVRARTIAASGVFSSVVLATVSSAVFAAPINHGTFVGATVQYIDVTEDSATDPVPAGGIFGAPTVTGDSMDFDPNNFAATATGANGTDTTDVNLKFNIESLGSNVINTVMFSESGDVSLSGFSNDAFASVKANVHMEIYEVNGNPVTEINLPPQAMIFTPNNGEYQLSSLGGPNFGSSWTGKLLVSLAPYLNAGEFATGVSVSLDNTLVALSQDGTTSFIQKKDTDAVTITTNIPEPTTSAIALIASLSLVAVSRRK